MRLVIWREPAVEALSAAGCLNIQVSMTLKILPNDDKLFSDGRKSDLEGRVVPERLP
jgi:hypothetical protein